MKCAKDEIYTLGTWFYKDPQQTNLINYEKKIQEFESVLQYWKNMNLTIPEKIKIVKVFALAKINYVISSLEVTQEIVTRIQNSIFNFIWDGKQPKIKNLVAIQDTENGGLKIACMEVYIKANRATWTKRLLCQDNRSHQYLKMFLPQINLFHFLKCNYNPEDLPNTIPTFYFQILYAWFELKTTPNKAADVRREYFIFNRHISINNNYVYYPRFIQNNILSINELLDTTGKFLSYDLFSNKYGSLLSQFKYMSLIDAIPKEWKQLLKKPTTDTNISIVDKLPYCKLGLKECSMHTIKSCEIYWHIVGKCKTPATCVNAWKERINVTSYQHFWKAVFCLPYNCINDFRVKALQTKIIHRFYPC